MPRYLGLMSGTSVDGIDAAIIEISTGGTLTVIATHHHAIPAQLRSSIEALMQPGADEIDRLGETDGRLGNQFAEAAASVLAQARLSPRDIRAIGSHGQTVRHRPRAGHPFTLQIGNPAIIAERTGITTVADFRRRDMAAGGEGAPLVPAFHEWRFRSAQRDRVIVNLGGIANVTHLPSDKSSATHGFDTGPGNTLLDRWVEKCHGERCDEAGRWAATGQVDERLLNALLADEYFARKPPKSTGREHFSIAWLEARLGKLAQPASEVDVQATLAALTAHTVARAIKDDVPACDEAYVCGGGAHNADLMDRLRRELAPIPVQPTDVLGIPVDWVEAVAFAWLAHRTLEGQPGNLPSVTGARHPAILGAIYPA
jgi:anhydro-N-acetylmuramic acid kinase